MHTSSILNKYSYLWVTLILFVASLIGHWSFAWFAFVNEQRAHSEEIVVSDYFVEVMRDTFENWQSEFLQLMWQVGGLALLLYVGSPQSKEGDDRKEEKINALLRLLSPEEGKRIIAELDKKFPKE